MRDGFASLLRKLQGVLSLETVIAKGGLISRIASLVGVEPQRRDLYAEFLNHETTCQDIMHGQSVVVDVSVDRSKPSVMPDYREPRFPTMPAISSVLEMPELTRLKASLSLEKGEWRMGTIKSDMLRLGGEAVTLLGLLQGDSSDGTFCVMDGTGRIPIANRGIEDSEAFTPKLSDLGKLVLIRKFTFEFQTTEECQVSFSRSDLIHVAPTLSSTLPSCHSQQHPTVKVRFTADHVTGLISPNLDTLEARVYSSSLIKEEGDGEWPTPQSRNHDSNLKGEDWESPYMWPYVRLQNIGLRYHGVLEIGGRYEATVSTSQSQGQHGMTVVPGDTHRVSSDPHSKPKPEPNPNYTSGTIRELRAADDAERELFAPSVGASLECLEKDVDTLIDFDCIVIKKEVQEKDPGYRSGEYQISLECGDIRYPGGGCNESFNGNSIILYDDKRRSNFPKGIRPGSYLSVRGVRRFKSNAKHVSLYCRALPLSCIRTMSASHITKARFNRRGEEGVERILLSGLYRRESISCKALTSRVSILSLSKVSLHMECGRCLRILQPGDRRCCGPPSVKLEIHTLLDDSTAQAQAFAEGDVAWSILRLRSDEKSNLVDKLSKVGPLSLRHGDSPEDEGAAPSMRAAQAYLKRLVSALPLPREVEASFILKQQQGDDAYKGQADLDKGECRTGEEWHRFRLGRMRHTMRVIARAGLSLVALREPRSCAELAGLLAQMRCRPRS